MDHSSNNKQTLALVLALCSSGVSAAREPDACAAC